ncbi:unnamed protein product [Dracunculus medinensis]|uniref:Cystinosin homolog n=1 Tax=Dracunculus medinensis TaxID=318479 RepID=A0A0N4ULW9_DRAME|nr:unnamed protein product [Dracunculus medinensis]
MNNSKANLSTDVNLTLKRVDWFDATPNVVVLDKIARSANVSVTGIQITSRALLEIKKCEYSDSPEICPFSEINRTFAVISVIHSESLSVLIIVVGWIYFFAWSISFYPQIILNFKRRSVVGLSFDFLFLNIIGFACYSVYNVFFYFDKNIQKIYFQRNPHCLIPVLLNDVIFAVHALLICLFTAFQCFIYERGSQRISYTCWALSSSFIGFALVSFCLTFFDVINALQFITFLSYIKMAVTCSKYFPQAFFNFRRKSTAGWSVGNVLLDFLGGSMDICQIILQGANTDDWSVFTGNPVKFGLGCVSMLFDIVFIIQHYVLYRNSEETKSQPNTNTVTNSDIGEIDIAGGDPNVVRVATDNKV